MPTPRRIHHLLDRLADAEDRFLHSDFLAPALRGGQVCVRIAGVICKLKVVGDFSGWGVFRPAVATTARLIRPATLEERRRYLEALPRRKLILCQPRGAAWLAWPAQQADRRFPPGGPVLLRFVEEAERFETVQTRCDGMQHWFEELDSRGDPAAAAFLREQFQQLTPPEQVQRPGLTAEHRAAYAFVHALRQETERDQVEERLRRALAHGGGELRGYSERDDVLRVEFVVDGERHLSVVRKGDLSVQLAGICLDGADQHFDLSSLVGVLREAQEENVLRIGADNQGMNEEQYWQVHPPRPIGQ